METNSNSSDFSGFMFWNIANTCGIFMLFLWILCIQDIPIKCEKRMAEIESKLELYENMKQDTIVIHIHNKLDIPKN